MPPTRADAKQILGDLAEMFGWRHHRSHYPGLTRDGYADGFPADVLLRGDRLLFVAITGRRGGLIPPERAWTEGLREVKTVEVLVIGADELPAVWRVLGQPGQRGPPEPKHTKNDVRPGQRDGRQKPNQAPPGQEEA